MLNPEDYIGQLRWLHMQRPTGPLVPRAIIGARSAWFNVSTRRVGGLRFIKVGRLCLSFCITKTYRPM